ncbi:YbaK/EbsC family protein [Celerinatantimonas yamalensis]|uniref:YbaK/EbsC family protein n=1 Tax=Celerinatantimonas yamalensis TaxID=559956 RepID=A0ABW9G4G4_9GAMM
MNQGDRLYQVRQTIAHVLARLDIGYVSYDHPPLGDCRRADELGLVRQGTRVKNLFLQDNAGKRHFLLVVPASCQVDLKALATAQQTTRLGLASSRRLALYLNLTPGCVSPLALAFDRDRQVELWIDQALWQSAKALQCHPGDNRQTWVIETVQLARFFSWSGHRLTLVNVTEINNHLR